MKQDEIIEMWKNSGDLEILGMPYSKIEAFAKLVAATATDEANARSNTSWALMCKKMVEQEREEIDQMVNDDSMLSDNDAIRLSRAIRARGEA